MIDFDTAVVCFFVAMAGAGYCLPSLGLLVGGFLGAQPPYICSTRGSITNATDDRDVVACSYVASGEVALCFPLARGRRMQPRPAPARVLSDYLTTRTRGLPAAPP